MIYLLKIISDLVFLIFEGRQNINYEKPFIKHEHNPNLYSIWYI